VTNAASVLLVHGAGGTPSTWSAVEPLLNQRGHRTLRVVNPLTSLADDIACTIRALDQLGQAGHPVLAVGHSYGGAVITNVGRDPRVAGLVYVAAFAPEENESVQQIVSRYPPAEVSKFMRRGPNGEWKSVRDDAYWAEIGWDLAPAQRAEVMSEHRESADAIFAQATGEPAWQQRPSWYIVAADDKTLPPAIQRDMAARAGAVTSVLPGSHYTPWTHPQEVAAVVLEAAARVAG
jgi:pimeloyl-ACP methyl ester carboxylesterase